MVQACRAMASTLGASTDLGLGGALKQQTQDEEDEEKRRKRLGLSPLQSAAAQQLFGLGKAGAGNAGGF